MAAGFGVGSVGVVFAASLGRAAAFDAIAKALAHVREFCGAVGVEGDGECARVFAGVAASAGAEVVGSGGGAGKDDRFVVDVGFFEFVGEEVG